MRSHVASVPLLSHREAVRQGTGVIAMKVFVEDRVTPIAGDRSKPPEALQGKGDSTVM